MTNASVSHLLALWLLPPGCCILFGIEGLILLRSSRKMAAIFLSISIISLWIFSMPLFAYKLIAVLQNQYPLLTPAKMIHDANTALVVLGGGKTVDVAYHNKPVVTETTFHRLRYAAYLHHSTSLPIIVSGGNADVAKVTEADLMQQTLKEDFHIETVIKENKGNNTAEESQYLVPILKEHHFKRIYLITNAWHMPRSMYVFRYKDIEVIPAPMGYAVYNSNDNAVLTYLPSADSLNMTSIALHELLGLLWYSLSR